MFRRNKEQREIDQKVLKFTMELFKILFMKNTSIADKYQMLLLHVLENKVWFCYFLGVLAVITIIILSSL